MASPQLPSILFSEIISNPGTLFLDNEHSLNEQIINMYINMYKYVYTVHYCQTLEVY